MGIDWSRTSHEAILNGTFNPPLHAGPVHEKRGKAGVFALRCAMVFGLATIYFSSEYIARAGPDTILLPWQFPRTAINLFIATGIMLMVSILLKPLMLWPVVVGTAIFTSGVSVLGFSIFDEWLVGWIVVGGMFAVAIGRVPKRRGRIHKEWVVLFLVFSLYLLIMSVVGFFLYGNPKAVRFTMVFGVVLVLGYLLAKYEFPCPDARRITLLIGGVGLVFYVVYIIHSLVFFPAVKFSVFEGIGFVGTGNEAAPAIVAVPAAFILIARERGWRKLLGYVVLCLCFLMAALADSRAGMVAVVGTALIAPFAIGVLRSFRIVLVLISVSLVIGVVAFGRIQWGLDTGEALARTFVIEGGHQTWLYHNRMVTSAKGDAGRLMYVLGAIESLIHGNPLMAFTGTSPLRVHILKGWLTGTTFLL